MHKAETRAILYQRSLEQWCGDDLRDSDIEKIMRIEDNETTLLMWEYDPTSGGKQTPASGGKWYIRGGNMMMLAELAWWTCDHMTMYDIYRMWISLPILSYRRKHSESQSDKAVRVRNAKLLKHAETGRWGLNERRRQSRL